MTRGYESEKIKEDLIEILKKSKTGLTGVEISKKLDINRITMSKYLNVFAAEGIIKQNNKGNVNLWSVDEDIDLFNFPSEIFQVKKRYLDHLLAGEEKDTLRLIKNSLLSKGRPTEILTEVLLPAIEYVRDIYLKGKIGNSEKNFLEEIIFNSIQIINLKEIDTNTQKNVVVFSSDHESMLLSKIASSALHCEEWRVFQLGEMSSTIDLMFDIDFQKFLNKIWPDKRKVLLLIVFSLTEGGSKFFSETLSTIKSKYGKTLQLAFCTKQNKKTKIKADLITEDLTAVIQWCQTVYEGMLS